MEATIRSKSSFVEILKAYRGLMKLPIVILLVFTTLTSMVVAANGLPTWEILIPTLIGGFMAASGASALNQYIDRDMDGKMARTSRRPIPSGRVAPVNALLFGLALIAWAVLIQGVFVNWLSAGLSLFGAFYYVVLYTMLLKRNTVVNIVIGGGAGAIPCLVGYAAVSNSITIEGIILFAIVFFWTPPHSWALAILVNKDYEAANVPMMPVARGEEVTRWQILAYSVQLVIVTLIPTLSLLLNTQPMLGWFYTISAILLGGGMIFVSVRLLQVKDKVWAKIVYKYSSLYLAALYMAMIIDRLI
jgi:heme o synthase